MSPSPPPTNQRTLRVPWRIRPLPGTPDGCPGRLQRSVMRLSRGRLFCLVPRRLNQAEPLNTNRREAPFYTIAGPASRAISKILKPFAA